MEIFVSIDGVLRNTIQKFDYHYKDYFLNTETDEEEKFNYGVDGTPLSIENLLNTYRFQSIDEFNKFLYFDFPIEIYGHAGLSYNQASTDLNSFIFENKNVKITLVGLSENGKAKPATLFLIQLELKKHRQPTMYGLILYVSLHKNHWCYEIHRGKLKI